MDCFFCGEENTVYTEMYSSLYICTCGFCGARGSSHFTELEALDEWQAILDKITASPTEAPNV